MRRAVARNRSFGRFQRTTTNIRAVLIGISGLCVLWQFTSLANLKKYDHQHPFEGSKASLGGAARGLQLELTDADREWVDGETPAVAVPRDVNAPTRAEEEEATAFRTAKLLAVAEKAQAEAESAKLEAEKMKQQVARAKEEAERAKKEAAASLKAKEEAQAAQLSAQKRADQMAAEQKAREEKAQKEREAAKKAEEQKKIAEEEARRAKDAAEQAARAEKELQALKEQEDAKRLKEEEEAKKAEEEKKLAEQEGRKTEMEKREERRRQQREEQAQKQQEQAKILQEEEEAKKAEEMKKLAEEEARKEQAQKQQEEAKRLKEEEEAKKAEEMKKLAEQEARKEQAQKQQEEAKKLKQEEVARKAEEEKKMAEEEARKSDLEKREERRRQQREEQAQKQQEEAKRLEEAKKAEEKKSAKSNTEKQKNTQGTAETKREDGQATKLPVVPKGPGYKGDKKIRQWGCARNETPFIFVHIGKAGGGGVRARMAAAALDYSRTQWKDVNQDPSYYYPVYDAEGKMHKGRFANSKLINWLPKSLPEFENEFVFEGFEPCSATTPLGQALVCSTGPTELCRDRSNSTKSDNRCDLVYMGHNMIGSELHWLPTNYLVDWWKSTQWGKTAKDFIQYLLTERFLGGGGSFGEWKVHPVAGRLMKEKRPDLACPKGPLDRNQYNQSYEQCAAPKESWMDEVTKFGTGNDPVVYGAQVIASLPVLRATVLREPFSWLLSKFFWHEIHYLKDGKTVTPDSGQANNNQLIKKYKEKNRPEPTFVKCDDIDQAIQSWATVRAMTLIFYLCGEHCMGGWAKGTLTLDDAERQAAYNLRNSFAVVGLLEKTDEFYDMVTQRVYYLNTKLNPHVEGQEHASHRHREAMRCQKVYKDPEFQSKMMAKSPVVAALYRLYLIATEVNEFQKKELVGCSTTSAK